MGAKGRHIHDDELARSFEVLYRESFDDVYSHVRFQMLDEEAARDVTSDAFLRAARFFERYDSRRAKFSTWVKAIARNCINDYYRKNKPTVPLEDAPESTFASDDADADKAADADLARRLLAVLDEEERELVRMKYYMEMRNVEIAQSLGMNSSTVGTRLQRALLKMRAAASKETAVR